MLCLPQCRISSCHILSRHCFALCSICKAVSSLGFMKREGPVRDPLQCPALSHSPPTNLCCAQFLLDISHSSSLPHPVFLFCHHSYLTFIYCSCLPFCPQTTTKFLSLPSLYPHERKFLSVSWFLLSLTSYFHACFLEKVSPRAKTRWL